MSSEASSSTVMKIDGLNDMRRFKTYLHYATTFNFILLQLYFRSPLLSSFTHSPPFVPYHVCSTSVIINITKIVCIYDFFRFCGFSLVCLSLSLLIMIILFFFEICSNVFIFSEEFQLVIPSCRQFYIN